MSSDLGGKVEIADFKVAAKCCNFCHCDPRTCLLPQVFARPNFVLAAGNMPEGQPPGGIRWIPSINCRWHDGEDWSPEEWKAWIEQLPLDKPGDGWAKYQWERWWKERMFHCCPNHALRLDAYLTIYPE